MAKVYNVSYDIETYQKLYNKREESGDYIGALSVLKKMSLINGNDIDNYQKFADLYYYLEQYDLSVEYRYKYLGELDRLTLKYNDGDNTVIKPNENDYYNAYAALGCAYYKAENKRVASYYFNKAVKSTTALPATYTEVFREFLADVTDISSNYYLAYPYEKADFSALIDNAEELFKSGEYQEVINALKVIPKTNKYYVEALSLTALCKYFLDDNEGSLIDFDTAVSLDNLNVINLCNAISINNKLGNYDKVENYLKLLEKVTDLTDDELYKTVMAYSECGKPLLAKQNAKKYLINNPYDTNVLLILGQIEYNLKNYDKAEKYFKNLVDISGSWVSKFYYNLVAKKLEDKEVEEYIDYNFDVPEYQRKKIVNGVTHFLKNGCENLSAQDEDLIYYLSNYAFESRSYGLQSSCVTLLTSLRGEKSQKYLASQLVKTTVFDQIKTGILGFLTADGFEGLYPAQFGNIYKKIKFVNMKFDGVGAEVMNEAYALCFAKLAPVENSLASLRLKAFDMFYSGVDFTLIKDIKSLSATLFELSGIKKIANRREFAKFFGANLKEVKRLKQLFLSSQNFDNDFLN